MSKKEGVQVTNKKAVITAATKDNYPLQCFLLPLAEGSMGIAVIRKYCSFTKNDWLCYLGCVEYEPLKNRDEEDRSAENSINLGKNWGTPDESRVLSEKLFKQLKDEDYPHAKKINHDLYLWLRFRDHGLINHQEQLKFLRE